MFWRIQVESFSSWELKKHLRLKSVKEVLKWQSRLKVSKKFKVGIKVKSVKMAIKAAVMTIFQKIKIFYIALKTICSFSKKIWVWFEIWVICSLKQECRMLLPTLGQLLTILWNSTYLSEENRGICRDWQSILY